MFESPGRILSEARLERGGSLQEYAERTKIPVSSLEALEADNWSWMAAPVYVKGFIRAYALELDLDPEPLIAAWRNASSQAPQGTAFARRQTITSPEAPNRSFRMAAGIALGAVAFVIWLVLNSGLSPQPDRALDDDGTEPVTSEDARNHAE